METIEGVHIDKLLEKHPTSQPLACYQLCVSFRRLILSPVRRDAYDVAYSIKTKFLGEGNMFSLSRDVLRRLHTVNANIRPGHFEPLRKMIAKEYLKPMAQQYTRDKEAAASANSLPLLNASSASLRESAGTSGSTGLPIDVTILENKQPSIFVLRVSLITATAELEWQVRHSYYTFKQLYKGLRLINKEVAPLPAQPCRRDTLEIWLRNVMLMARLQTSDLMYKFLELNRTCDLLNAGRVFEEEEKQLQEAAAAGGGINVDKAPPSNAPPTIHVVEKKEEEEDVEVEEEEEEDEEEEEEEPSDDVDDLVFKSVQLEQMMAHLNNFAGAESRAATPSKYKLRKTSVYDARDPLLRAAAEAELEDDDTVDSVTCDLVAAVKMLEDLEWSVMEQPAASEGASEEPQGDASLNTVQLIDQLKATVVEQRATITALEKQVEMIPQLLKRIEELEKI